MEQCGMSQFKVMRSRSSLYRDYLSTIKETIRIYFIATSEVCRNKREKQLVDPVEKKLLKRLQTNLSLTLKSFANFFALFFSSFYRLTFVLKIMTFLMLYMLLEGWHFYSPRVPPPPPIMIRFFLIIFPTCLSFHVPRYFFAPLVPLE